MPAFNLKFSHNQRKAGRVIIPFFLLDGLNQLDVGTIKSELLQRPVRCHSCLEQDCFWGHGSYVRQVVHNGTELELKIKRFICYACGKTVSLLFSFLVAHRKHSAVDIAAGVQEYVTEPASYRRISNELSSLDSDRPPSPSHGTVFRWVKDLCACATSLRTQMQKELGLHGQWTEMNLSENQSATCPNAPKARSVEKRDQLDALSRLLQFGAILVADKYQTVESLHAYFLKNAETIRMILCNHLITLSAPHNLRLAF